jgi:PAS domain S-box-containing protein
MQKAILDNAGLSIFSTSADGIIQTFNPAAEQMLGYSADEVIGKVSSDIFHGTNQLNRFAAQDSRIPGITAATDYRGAAGVYNLLPAKPLECDFIHKQGNRFPVNLTVSSYEDASGATGGYIGVAMDVTAEKKAMESLRLSEERFHAMFHNHAAVMFLVNPETGFIIEANKAAADYYGYEFNSDNKVHINDINILSHDELARQMKEAAIQDRNYFIFQHKLASGEIRLVEVHSSPIDVEGDKLLFSVIHDITERSEAEELLRKSEAENRAILTAVPDFLFRLDKDGVFLSFHTGSTESLLVEPDIFLGKNTRDILPPPIADKAMNALQQAFSTGETITFEYELPVDGNIHYFEDRVLAISDNEALSIIRDITPRIIAEKALQWNESLLKKMTESSPLAFLVVDNRTDDILYSNHRFFEIWGITHLEEQVQKSELKNNDIIPGCLPVLKDIPAFAASCAPLQLLDNHAVLEDEIPFIDGRIIRRFSTQLRDDDGQYHGRLYIFEDITERKTTEQFIRIQRDLAIKLSACSNLNEALALSLDSLLQFDVIDAVGIFLLNEEADVFNLTAHSGISERYTQQLSTVRTDSHFGDIVLKGKPYYGTFDEIVGRAFPTSDSSGYHHVGLIPIKFEGRVIGSFNVGSKSVQGFSQNSIIPIESLALQVGGAISRINAENALLSSQLNFKTLFDTIDDFLFILDVDGNIMQTNPVVQQRLGYTSAELQELNILNVHPPERQEEARFVLNEMNAGRTSYCSIPLCAKDGTLISVETRIIAGRWDNKDVLYGISRDITELRKTEKELQLRESYLSAVINNHPGMFWMKDLDGKYLLVNEHNDKLVRLLTERPGNDILGITDFGIFNEEDAQRYLEEDQQVIDTRMPLIIEEQKVIDNKLIWFEKSKFPVVDKQN